jgi:transcriptional regulator of acetoin/glycerol metabolism
LDRAKILADDDRIRVENLPPEIVKSARSLPTSIVGNFDLDKLTHDHVMETYQRHSRNKARTARALGIGRRTLYRLLEKYHIAAAESDGQEM